MARRPGPAGPGGSGLDASPAGGRAPSETAGPPGAGRVDAHGRLVHVGPELAALLGRDVQDCLGRELGDLGPAGAALAAAVQAEVREAAREAGGAVVAVVPVQAQVTDADGRLTLLSRSAELFSPGLDTEQTLDALAELVLPALGEHLVVDLQEGPGEPLRRVRHASLVPSGGSVDAGPAADYDLNHPHRQVLATGEPLGMGALTAADLSRWAPTRGATWTQLGVGSLVCAPLSAADTLLGVASVLRGDAAEPSAQDVSLLGELGRRAGVALAAAQRYAAEREAHRVAEQQRRYAEEAVARLAVLHDVTRVLSSAQTGRDVASVVTERTSLALGARSVAVMAVTDDGQGLEILHARGINADAVELWSRFRLDEPVPAAEAVRTGRRVRWDDEAERRRLFPQLPPWPGATGTYLVLPLHVGQRPVGCLSLGWDAVEPVTREQEVLVTAVAAQCAQALDRVRLLQSERRALAEAQRQRDRLTLLTDVGRELAGALGYGPPVQRATRMVADRLGACCWVNVLEDSGMQVIAWAHRDLEREAAMDELVRLSGGYTDNPLVHQVVTDGLVHEVPGPALVAVSEPNPSERAAELLRRLGPGAGVVAPLLVGGETIGTLTVLADDGSPPFSPDDVHLVAQIGRRLASAIGFARQYAQRADIAVTLQRSLLPADPPPVEGLEVAHRYAPGTAGTEVGGDWFDVIPLSSGRTAVVLGDVMGRGVRAAAVMGQVRAAVRAYAAMELPPDEVLGGLDRVVRGFGEVQIVTAIYAVYDPGAQQLLAASAGHLAPLLLHDDGAPPDLLELPVGIPLGVGGPPYVAREVELPPGTGLLLYTDGLVEDRTRDIDAGIAGLAAAVAGSVGAAAVCDAALRSVDDAAELTDDVAVLALCTTALGPTATPWAVREIGAELEGVRAARRWAVEAVGRPVDGGALELVVSELVTNAVRHGSAPRLLRVRRSPRGVLVEVQDGDRSLPRPVDAALDDEGGRGLLLVGSMCSSWGIRPTPRGKVVWVELTAP